MAITWQDPISITCSNISDLGDGTIWQSGTLSRSSPTKPIITFFFYVTLDIATMADGDTVTWYMSTSRDGTNWDGRIAATANNAITGAGAIHDVEDMCPVVATVSLADISDQTTGDIRGSFTIYNAPPNLQVLMQVSGCAIETTTSTPTLHYIEADF